MTTEIRNLTADEIEVKIKKVDADVVIALLYKTARTDMAILDEVFGPENWQCDYKDIKQNLYCGIAVRTQSGEWIWRWDCGIESREDAGNEKKGEASDAFKRAGTRWGIGRELYTSPFIRIKAETIKNERGGYKLKDKYAKYSVEEIDYIGKKISRLVIADRFGNNVFTYPQKMSGGTQPSKMGDREAKGQASGKQTSVGQASAQSAEERLKAAMEMEITIKNVNYKIGTMSQEQLLFVKNNAKVEKYQEAAALVLKYRFQKQMQEQGEGELPFKDDETGD